MLIIGIIKKKFKVDIIINIIIIRPKSYFQSQFVFSFKVKKTKMLLLLRDFCHYQYLLIFLIYLVIFFQIQSSITINSATINTSNRNLYRLPNTSVPVNYDLSISLNDIDDYFNGNIKIEIIIKNTTNEIVLNARNLNSFQINIIDLHTNLSIPNIQFKNKNPFLIIHCDDKRNFIENHKYLLNISYNGTINDYEAAIFKTESTELT